MTRFSGRDIDWKVHRTPQGLLLFVLVGIMAGMFGIGAGWANVPVLNLVMGAPLKVSIGTSSFLLSIVDSAAAWVYLHHGAMLAIIAVPSMLGMMLGSTDRRGAALARQRSHSSQGRYRPSASGRHSRPAQGIRGLMQEQRNEGADKMRKAAAACAAHGSKCQRPFARARDCAGNKQHGPEPSN